MKRLFCFILALLALLSGCVSNRSTDAESNICTTSPSVAKAIPRADITLMQTYMEDLLDGLYDHSTSVYEWEGGFSIHISMEGGMDETTFADFVVDGVATLQEHLPEFNAPLHEFSVCFTISDPSNPSNNGSMLWVTTDLITGILTDTANGHNHFKPTATPQDLIDMYGSTFPIGE